MNPLLCLTVLAWCLAEGALTGATEASTELLYRDAMKASFGLGGEVNEARAKELYLQAAEQGDPRAQAWKARHMFRGLRGFEKKPEEAKILFRKAEQGLVQMADQDLPDARRSLALSWAVFHPQEKGKEAFQILQALSRGNSPVDYGSLAWAYEEGIGVKKNPGQAFAWYKKSADTGNVNALADLGACYEQGLGVAKNPSEALRWYREAADRGLVWAQRRLGICHEEGIGVAKNEQEAVRWYQQAADRGDGWALNRLGLCFEHGRGVEKDPAKAYAYYLKSAEAGDVWGQNNAGNALRNGFGVPQDYAKALAWYQKSADQDHAVAWENLGLCFARGQGTAKDETEALRCFQRAGELGSGWAQAETGRYFIEGLGTKKDKKIALGWLRRAADQGNAYAQSWVGYAAEKGWEQLPDTEEAMRWYRMSAEGGRAWSWAALGACLQNQGGTANLAEAARCFQKANWAGDAWGTRMLAECYLQGRGVERNSDLAAALYERAVGTSEDVAARRALVDLHWGGPDRWEKADLKKGMDHWLVLHPDPARRIRAIYETTQQLLEQGKPRSVSEVLDLFEKQGGATQPLPADLKVFRAYCRLLADRHVPETWALAIPAWLQPLYDRIRPHLKEAGGNHAKLNSGQLEIYQTTAPFGSSSPRWLLDAWQNHLAWFLRLWAEEESGWYHSFVRSLQAKDRPVNLRWLEAGVSRGTEAWTEVAGLPVEQLQQGGVAGCLLIGRLQENPARSKELLARLDQIEAEKNALQQKNDEKESVRSPRKQKKNRSQSHPNDAFAQIRGLAQPQPISPRWWHEKGQINFGYGFSNQEIAGGSRFFVWHELFPFEEMRLAWYRLLALACLKTRPDLVLKLANFGESLVRDGRYQMAAYSFVFDQIYEGVARHAPSARPEALAALVRWNRFLGNEVTADQWETILRQETSGAPAAGGAPKTGNSSISETARIPEGFQDTANQANQLYREGKLEEAARQYQLMLAKYPNSLYGLSNLGVVRFQQKKYTEAEKALRESIRLSPNDAFSHSVLGIVLVQQDKDEKAKEVLEKAVKLDPQDAKAWNYLGITCSRLKDTPAALQCFQKAVELDPRYGDAHFNLAISYATSVPANKKDARKHYQQARDLNIPPDRELENLCR